MVSRQVLAVVLATGLLTGCLTDGGEKPMAVTLEGGELSELMASLPKDRLNDHFIQSGVDDLREGDYVAASKAFNRALKFDPANANLHFLNGLAYHLRAEAGDSSQFEFAMVGYELALRYDPGNSWAAYLSGQILLREQNYRRAQDAFAYALLNAPDNVTVLKALASASYLAQDLVAATEAIDRAVALAPDDREVQYNRVLINAAAGHFDDAQSELAAYRQRDDHKTKFRVSYLTRRLGDWRRFHDKKLYLKKAQFSSGDIFGSGSDSSDTSSENTSSDETSSDTSTASSDSNAGGGKAKGGDAAPRMALIDVVIIRSEEIQSTDKGVNLLNGLTATLGGTTITYNQTSNLRGAGPTTANVTWAPSLSIASSAYALNIFNDNYDRNEVLARPTLVALDGQQSTFFSGAVWHIALDGVSGSQGTISDVNVGIHLDVTPTFKSDDTMQINVSASRAYIEAIDTSASFGTTPAAQTTDTKVTANVTLKFGETLVLSGLSERETENLDDGVPLLRDLPGIQYLFSHQDTLDSTKSVLILLTPRKPRYTYADGTDKMEPEVDKDTKQPHLKELEAREGWFKPAANIDAVFYHLRNGSFFKEFRQGDLAVERWAEPDRLERMIVQTLQFLYY